MAVRLAEERLLDAGRAARDFDEGRRRARDPAVNVARKTVGVGAAAYDQQDAAVERRSAAKQFLHSCDDGGLSGEFKCDEAWPGEAFGARAGQHNGVWHGETLL